MSCTMRRVASWSVCLLAFAAAADDHDHADHGAYEWAGIFEVLDAKYMWTAQKVDGAYADATMKLVALPAAEATSEQLSALEEEGEHSMEEACTPLEPGGVITPAEHACYELRFDSDLWQSLYTVDTSGVTAVAFFTEHVPTEFENTAHYLKDSSGEDVEPLAELPEAEEEAAKSADWAASLGAAAVVSAITLVGLVLLAPGISRLAKAHSAVLESVLSAFAAGALLACAFFLLLFESTHLIAEGWEKEVDVLWRWGTMVLAGFLLPGVVAVSCTWVLEAKQAPAEEQANDVMEAGAADEKETLVNIHSRARVIGAVVIGDFFHNLCDGFFIGAAFKSCGASFGWGVALGTALHEIPQELADYAILTGTAVGMAPAKALFLNFLAGLSVILGVIVINATEVENSVTGLLLAFGGGTYVYLGAAECMPRVHHKQLSAKMHLLCMLAFMVGAVLIGLILLDHKHCVPDDGAGHAGHGH